MESYKIKHKRKGDLPEYSLICNRLGWYNRDKIGIDRITLTIPGGEAFGIIGESVGGQTTLFDVVACSRRLSYGRVYVDGHPLEFLCQLHGYPFCSVKDLRINLAKVFGLGPRYDKNLMAIKFSKSLINFDMLSDSIDSSGRLKLWRLLDTLLANGYSAVSTNCANSYQVNSVILDLGKFRKIN
uniref:ABC transporter domain-containing protein n=1 Tax=Glossina austeni TaxID=7395 RepID=A0A1A9UDN1_GLOAU